MCPRTPMEPLEVHVEVVLIMWWFLVDQELLPVMSVHHILVMLHNPILLCVPVPSIVPAMMT